MADPSSALGPELLHHIRGLTLVQPRILCGGRATPDLELALTVFGLGQCEGAENDLKLFFEALQWLVKTDAEYEPSLQGSASDPVATAEELRHHLWTRGKVPSSTGFSRIGMLLRCEPPSIASFG